MGDTTVYIGRSSFRMKATSRTSRYDAAVSTDGSQEVGPTGERVVLFRPGNLARTDRGRAVPCTVNRESGNTLPILTGALVTDFAETADTAEIPNTLPVASAEPVAVVDRLGQILGREHPKQIPKSANLRTRRNIKLNSGQQSTPLWVVASTLVAAALVTLWAESSFRQSPRSPPSKATQIDHPTMARVPVVPIVRSAPFTAVPAETQTDLDSARPRGRSATSNPDSEERRELRAPSSKEGKPAHHLHNKQRARPTSGVGSPKARK